MTAVGRYGDMGQSLGQQIDAWTSRSAQWPRWKLWAFVLAVMAVGMVLLTLLLGGVYFLSGARN